MIKNSKVGKSHIQSLPNGQQAAASSVAVATVFTVTLLVFGSACYFLFASSQATMVSADITRPDLYLKHTAGQITFTYGKQDWSSSDREHVQTTSEEESRLCLCMFYTN